MSEESKIVVVNQSGGKSVGAALLLTFLFGPLGMFYSTITGGIVMLILDILAFIFTAGIGLFFTWPIQMIWAATAASKKQSTGNQITVIK
jgi:hypothetical protein